MCVEAGISHSKIMIKMAAPSTLDTPVARVQIDGLVVLKIIKHCEEEGGGHGELVQGVLLGLVQGDTLEITNCFPFPKNADEDGFDDEQYQMEMMRNLRHVNIDHLHVGWYQSTQYGAFLNKPLMESQFNYQNSIEESVVLIYDPVKTAKSTLSLKPYRLTPAAIEAYKEDDFSPASLKKHSLGFENLFEEIPIVVKNSHLINALVCEVEEVSPPSGDSFLSLSSGNLLEKNVELLMEQVDELNQDINKYVNYQRQINKLIMAKQQYLYKREQENKARVEKGEARLPDEDLNKLFKAPTVPPRLDGLLSSGQMDVYCKEVNKLASQTFGKLFLADALQSNPSLS